MEERLAGMKSPAEVLGARLLKDIEKEEGSLESLLLTLQKSQPIPSSKTGLPPLDTIWKNHNQHPTQPSKLSITNRGLPLLYHLIHHQIRILQQTITVLDISGTFSPTHLNLTREELGHVHVFRPNVANVKATVESMEKYMLFGEESVGSRGREWGGTVVNGGVSGGEVCFGWRGWLGVERVDRGEGFGVTVSVEEAVEERKRRGYGVSDGDRGEGVWWRAVSEAGEFSWSSL